MCTGNGLALSPWVTRYPLPVTSYPLVTPYATPTPKKIIYRKCGFGDDEFLHEYFNFQKKKCSLTKNMFWRTSERSRSVRNGRSWEIDSEDEGESGSPAILKAITKSPQKVGRIPTRRHVRIRSLDGRIIGKHSLHKSVRGLEKLRNAQTAMSSRTSDAIVEEMLDLVSNDRLVLVSNRLPVRFSEVDELDPMTGDKKLKVELAAGGIASSLRRTHANLSVVEETSLPWIGWCGLTTADGKVPFSATSALQQLGCVGIGLTPEEHYSFYKVISNRCIWPLFHYFTDQVSFSWSDWEVYKSVNRKFADEILRHANDGDVILVQDYHLCLVPQMLREANKNLRIGFFLHIPFPSSEIYRLLPARKQLLEGLLGADLISMHTVDYLRHFRTAMMRLLGYESKFRRVQLHGRQIFLQANPIGIDDVEWEQRICKDITRKEYDRLYEDFAGRRLILGVDRLDYTKGIPNRLKAFGEFLERNPTMKCKVVMLQIAVPSREGVEEYVELKSEVERMVGQINGVHGSVGYQPLHYLYRCVSQETLCALYQLADVALITPLRDGLNLVAKEYVMCRSKGDGVLILGECVGAAWELGGALRVNPFDTSSIATALKDALMMPLYEQKLRMKPMRRIVKRNNIESWIVNLLEGVRLSVEDDDSTRVSRPLKFNGNRRAEWDRMWVSATRRFLYLDYDGTLREFCAMPEAATPSKEILWILEQLAACEGTIVWIVSGRPAEFLERHFGHLHIGLVCEHGAAMRKPGCDVFEPLVDTFAPELWKDAVFESMSDFADYVPGSFVEVKSQSIAWHYRKAYEQGRSHWHARQFRSHLVEMLSTMPLYVKPGNCVLEVLPWA